MKNMEHPQKGGDERVSHTDSSKVDGTSQRGQTL